MYVCVRGHASDEMSRLIHALAQCEWYARLTPNAQGQGFDIWGRCNGISMYSTGTARAIPPSSGVNNATHQIASHQGNAAQGKAQVRRWVIARVVQDCDDVQNVLARLPTSSLRDACHVGLFPVYQQSIDARLGELTDCLERMFVRS